MYELPLFPLNTVLFPGAPLQLHIFEERYKQMVAFCRQNSIPFGVVLIESGMEASGPLAKPSGYGCTAQITYLQPLSEGRMNLLVMGEERFQILSTHGKKPYLSGIVRPHPIKMDDPENVNDAGKKLRVLVEKYLRLLGNDETVEVAISQLPEEPLPFAYLSAMLLQVPPKQKQIFLELENVKDLFSGLQSIYLKELSLIRGVLRKENPTSELPFSKN
jgi:Lon protease-like protein